MASSSWIPAILLALICFITFIALQILDGLTSKWLLTAILRLSVPIGFIIIIILYALDFIRALTGSTDDNQKKFTFIFIVLPFYLLSASALISDDANAKFRPPLMTAALDNHQNTLPNNPKI